MSDTESPVPGRVVREKCWRCGKWIDSELQKHTQWCPDCKYVRCPDCGACFCK